MHGGGAAGPIRRACSSARWLSRARGILRWFHDAAALNAAGDVTRRQTPSAPAPPLMPELNDRSFLRGFDLPQTGLSIAPPTATSLQIPPEPGRTRVEWQVGNRADCE